MLPPPVNEEEAKKDGDTVQEGQKKGVEDKGVEEMQPEKEGEEEAAEEMESVKEGIDNVEMEHEKEEDVKEERGDEPKKQAAVTAAINAASEVYAKAVQAGLSLEEVITLYHLICLFNHVVFLIEQAKSFNGFFPLFVNLGDENYPALPPNMTRLMEMKEGQAFQSMM